MPIIDDVTPNLGLPLPNADNFLADDVGRIRTSLTSLDAAVAAKANAASTTAALEAKADLVAGKVPAGQLPAYVDDVIEVANLASMPTTGEAGKIYVTLDTNKQYRWSGSIFVEISASPGTTDAVPEGSTNKYFTNARALSAIPPADASTLGLVKIGAGLGIDAGGALFASAGAGSFMSILEIVPPSNGLASVTVPGGYVVGAILVGVDGVLLPPSDYTATNGTTIGFVGFVVGTANTVLVVKLSTITLGNLPAGSVDAAQLADSAVTSSKIAAGVLPVPFRNRLVNGDLSFDQENNGAVVTVTAGGAIKYVLDQWYVSCTGSNITSQQAVGTSPNLDALKLTGGGSNTGTLFGQRIEGDAVADLILQDVVCSLMLSSSSITSVNWKAYHANTKDVFAAKTLIASGSLTINSTPTLNSFTFNAGANAKNGIAIEFNTGALLAGQTILLERAQLEKGIVVTDFEVRPPAIGLLMCQRFYERLYGYIEASSSSGTINYNYWFFKVPKRATPTVINAGSGASGNIYNVNGSMAGLYGNSGTSATFGQAASANARL